MSQEPVPCHRNPSPVTSTDEPIGIPSDRPARWISVARAMAIQENGTAKIDDFAMLKGFDLARQDAK